MEGIVHYNKLENEDFFWLKHNELIKSKKVYSSCYSRYNIEHFEQNSLDKGDICKDRSFILLNNGTPFFAFIGIEIKTKTNHIKLSAYDLPCSTVESNYITRNQLKFINKALSKLIDSFKGEIVFQDDFYNFTVSSMTEFLIKTYKVKPNLIYSRHIDLNLEESELKKRLSRRFTSFINWGEGKMIIKVFDKKNILYSIFEEFRLLHKEVAGKETRSKESWQKHYECIQNKEGFVVIGYMENKIVSGGYFSLSKTHSIYGVSASRRDLFDKPIFHALLWKAIKYAKEKRVKIFETGLEYSKEQEQFLTKKEVSIAKFKSGFGGNLKANLQINLNIGESST